MKTLIVSLTLRPIWRHFHISVHEWSSLLVMASIASSAILIFSDLDHSLIAILMFSFQDHFWITLIKTSFICKVNCVLLVCWNNTWEQNMKFLILAFQDSIGWVAQSCLVPLSVCPAMESFLLLHQLPPRAICYPFTTKNASHALPAIPVTIIFFNLRWGQLYVSLVLWESLEAFLVCTRLLLFL